MPTVDLSSFHQPSGTAADGTKFGNLIDTVQSALNGLDTNNLVPAAGITAGQLAAGVVGMSRICDFTATGALASFDTNTILGGSIPSTYSHLLIVFEGRGDTAAGSTGVSMRVNNDSGGNYENANAYMNGAAAFSGAGAGGGTNALVLGHMTAASALAGATGSCTFTISNYASTTLWRRWSGTGGADDGTNIWVETLAGAWRNTAAAINRIALTPGAGNFVAGSRFTLYGLS